MSAPVLSPKLEQALDEFAERNANAARRFWVALMLSPNLETFERLLDGDQVHPDALDQQWLAHFRRRGLWG